MQLKGVISSCRYTYICTHTEPMRVSRTPVMDFTFMTVEKAESRGRKAEFNMFWFVGGKCFASAALSRDEFWLKGWVKCLKILM